MRLGHFVAAAVTVLAVAGSGATRPADDEAIQGTWEVVGISDNGEKAPPEKFKGARMVITKDKLTILADGKTQSTGTYKLTAAARPRQIDLRVEEKHLKGIYDLRGDSLRLCFNENPGGPRPTAFESKKGSENDQLFELTRAKK
ncbi:MAG TPA: TIGR03067 domain-containing protein [Urbifossiella sp.]|nr:TIGR03067 domain-containing protein [Urbifossiella sp.]